MSLFYNNFSRVLRNALGVVFLIAPVSLTHAETEQSDMDLASSLVAQWNAAFNKADSAALANLYAEEASLSPGNGEVLKGREAIQSLFQGFMDAGVIEHAITVIEAKQSGNTLRILANWSAHIDKEDGTRVELGGILLNVLEQDEAGQWSSVSHVWNSPS